MSFSLSGAITKSLKCAEQRTHSIVVFSCGSIETVFL